MGIPVLLPALMPAPINHRTINVAGVTAPTTIDITHKSQDATDTSVGVGRAAAYAQAKSATTGIHMNT